MRWALLLLLVPSAAAEPLLVAVAPDLPGASSGDEGAALWSSTAMDLGGWSLSDGEGAWTFPHPFPVAAGETVWVTGNASAWAAHDGPAPRDTWTQLRLGNDGDDLALLAPDGRTVDRFSWGKGGDISHVSSAMVYQRRWEGGRPIDTDSANDWRTPRKHVIGESRLDAPSFQVSRLTLYSSPDSSFEVLTGLARSATQRLHLHVYELRSAALVDELVAARERNPNLDLQVLVEGQPVGRDAHELHAAADALQRIAVAGGQAWIAGGAAGNDRYAYHHLKVLVADDVVAVQSENWVETGVPQDPSYGNRGWGIVVHDDAVADWFAGWMEADRAAWDTAPFDLASFDPLFQAPPRHHPRSGDYQPIQPPRVVEGTFNVRPIIAPDHTADPAHDPLAQAVLGARERVWTQQLDLAMTARNPLGFTADDPLVAALEQQARAGLDVRVHAAAPFSADDPGNRPALERLRQVGALATEPERPGIATLHNKGILADSAVVVGSINGNHHSRSQNREVALLVEGPGVAGFFADLLRSDEAPPSPPRDFGVIPDDLEGIPAPDPTLLLVALVWLAARR